MAEWFVPRWGPLRFRVGVGLLFLPYTGMVLSFAVIGSMLAPVIYWDRVIAIVGIYFLGLGIAAHALDAAASKSVKPWGNHFTKRQLWFMAILSLGLAYGWGLYYILSFVPLLGVLAVLEGFFVFSYNLEWLGRRLHTDPWFAFSWGFLPTLAGYVIQTNSLSIASLVVGGAMALFSWVEISASRPYKILKRRWSTLREEEGSFMVRYESVLKSISGGVILLAGGLLLWRITG